MVKNYLLDSNIVYGLYDEQDRLHLRAIEEVNKLSKSGRAVIWLHDLVIIEVLTLIKYRQGLKAEKAVKKELFDKNKYKQTEETAKLTERSINIFEKVEKIGLIDAILIDYCLTNKIELVTFDKKMAEVSKKLRRN